MGDIVREVTRVDENSNAPVMMITANDGFIEQSERYSTDNAGKSLKKYILLKKWELAYNHGASKIRPFGSCFALTSVANIRIPFVYHCFLALEDNSEFLEYTLNSKNVENQLRKIVSSGARMDGLLNISFQEYTSIFIRCPIRKEQDIIAILIKSLDHLITLHQRKLEKLKIIKKSMLENLFPQNGEKTPKIRFSGFTKDWEQRKLGDYLEVSEEKNLNNEYTKENVLSVSGDVGIVNQIEFQGRSFAGILVNNYGVVKTGYVVYTKSPLKNNPYGIIKANKGRDGIVSTLYAIYKPKVNVNSNFIQIYFEQNARMNNYMQPLVNKGAKNDMKISSENALKGNVIFPIRIEQDIIVDFFFKIDHLITLHRSKFFGDILKTIASYALYWEQRKLGEVADIIGGGTPSTLNLDYWDGNIDWYSPAEIIDQIYVYRSQRKITELGFEKSSAKMLPEGTVLFTSRAGIGKTAILAKRGCTNQGFQSIVPYSNKLDSYFIFSRTEELKKYGELVGAGSTFVEVSGRQMGNMQLMIPKTIGEQHIIGLLFSTLDHLITLHQSKLDKLQKIKKSMLESMFV